MGTNHGGVNFGRRLPPIGGQYSTPINTRPSGPRNKAGSSPRQRRRSRPRSAPTASDGVDAPPDGIAMCQVGDVVNAKRGRGRPWNMVNKIGIDLAKNSFQVHGARADGSVVFRKKLSRAKLLDFVAAQPRCTVAMEACGGAHHWAGRSAGSAMRCDWSRRSTSSPSWAATRAMRRTLRRSARRRRARR